MINFSLEIQINANCVCNQKRLNSEIFMLVLVVTLPHELVTIGTYFLMF